MAVTTKADVLRYLDTAALKGLLNVHTANGWKAATRRILENVADEDDVSEFDVPGAVFQFNNRHPGLMAPESLRQYEIRVGRAIKEAQLYQSDPARYKAPVAAQASKPRKVVPDKEAPKDKRADMVVTSPEGETLLVEMKTHQQQRFATDVSLALPFPLRPGFLAQIVIPRDLSKPEADRLCAFIQALAQAPAQEVEQV